MKKSKDGSIELGMARGRWRLSKHGQTAHIQPPLMPDAPQCHYCNDTGMVACRSRDGQYAFAGPVPDDAKGYFDADCWYCDSGRPPVQAQVGVEPT